MKKIHEYHGTNTYIKYRVKKQKRLLFEPKQRGVSPTRINKRPAMEIYWRFERRWHTETIARRWRGAFTPTVIELESTVVVQGYKGVHTLKRDVEDSDGFTDWYYLKAIQGVQMELVA